MSLFNIVVTFDADANTTYPSVMSFETDYETQSEALEAAKRAVQAFLDTPAGQVAKERCGGRFTWNNAISFMPDHAWGDHGLHPFCEEVSAAILRHDEDVPLPHNN